MKNNEFDKREFFIELFEKYNGFLSQTQKQCFELYFFENFSYSEIAEICATSRSAAYDAVSKAIKKLENIHNKMK